MGLVIDLSLLAAQIWHLCGDFETVADARHIVLVIVLLLVLDHRDYE